MSRILIIDDDPAVRRMIATALSRLGHDVAESSDGAEGVQQYRARPSELVITDLYMPGQDGIETIQVLRDEFPDARILAISGGASVGGSGSLIDARLLGADDTLEKPFTLDQLAAVVNGLLAP
jgi:two-component system, chemotaxis family, chemotaxis protein CheY